jgi:hypothetical protein
MERGRGGHQLPVPAVMLPGVLIDLADEAMSGLGQRNLEVELGVQRQRGAGAEQRPGDQGDPPASSHDFRVGKHSEFCIRKELAHVNMAMTPPAAIGIRRTERQIRRPRRICVAGAVQLQSDGQE